MKKAKASLAYGFFKTEIPEPGTAPRVNHDARVPLQMLQADLVSCPCQINSKHGPARFPVCHSGHFVMLFKYHVSMFPSPAHTIVLRLNK